MKSAATDDLRDLVDEARRRGAGSLFVWGLATVSAVTIAFASWQYAPKSTAVAGAGEAQLATGSIPAAGANAIQARQVGGQRITTVPGPSDAAMMQKDLTELRQDLAELKRALGRAELSFEQMGRRIDGLEDQTAVLASRLAKPQPLAALPLPAAPPAPAAPAAPPQPAAAPQAQPPRPAAPPPPVAAKPAAVSSIEKTGDRPTIEAVPAAKPEPQPAAVEPPPQAAPQPQPVAQPAPQPVPQPAPQPAEAKVPRVIIKPLSADPAEPAVRLEPAVKDPAPAKPAETVQPKAAPLAIPAPAAPAAPEQAKAVPAAPVATVKIEPVRAEPPKPLPAPPPKSAQALQAAQAQQLAQQLLLQPQGANGLIPLPPQGQKLIAAQPVARDEQTASIPAQSAERTQFAVDLGGFKSMAQLRRAWSDTSTKHSGLVKGLAPLGQIKETGDQVEARLIAGPFANALDAAKFCAQVKGAGTACQPSVYIGQAIRN